MTYPVYLKLIVALHYLKILNFDIDCINLSRCMWFFLHAKQVADGEEADENSEAASHEHSNGEIHVRTSREDCSSVSANSLNLEPNDFDYNASDESEETSSNSSTESTYYQRNNNIINHDVVFGSRIQRGSSDEFIIVDNHYEVGIKS